MCTHHRRCFHTSPRSRVSRRRCDHLSLNPTQLSTETTLGYVSRLQSSPQLHSDRHSFTKSKTTLGLLNPSTASADPRVKCAGTRMFWHNSISSETKKKQTPAYVRTANAYPRRSTVGIYSWSGTYLHSLSTKTSRTCAFHEHNATIGLPTYTRYHTISGPTFIAGIPDEDTCMKRKCVFGKLSKRRLTRLHCSRCHSFC